MNPKILLVASLVLTVTLPLAAQREKAEAQWGVGAATIDYGSPTWRAAFADQMMKTSSWRMGSNDPTAIELTCGLMADEGCIPAGAYNLAMKKDDAGHWKLMVYAGGGFYNDNAKSWSISAASSTNKAEPAEKLSIGFDGKSKRMLGVHFGPHHVKYPITPIKMHKPVATEFARIKTKMDVAAVPCDRVKDLACGTATISPRGTDVHWDVVLTIDGEKATLTFSSDRATRIQAQKAAAQADIARTKKRASDSGQGLSERASRRIQRREDTIKALDAEAAAVQRFRASHSVTGTVKDRETPTSTLDFSHERIEGGIILTFGAGSKSATFDVNPREFFNRDR